ncbi:alpha/beta hydrolase [Sphingobium algorifonticola]|uniref:Alpha/beta hydrolase n=2 Tax=Sphingobium algorifonticola TaxID=2008318 RepID=A0A437J297_9SPHN|nr:alpha/beta hydrolase [Sphingobium algorifonticola]
MQRNLDFAAEAGEIENPPAPEWASANTVRLDMDTMRLRAFRPSAGGSGLPVLIDAPYAGHSATIADYDQGQSLVQTLMANGLGQVFVTDWKPATPQMRYFGIDTYLAELNAVIDDLGGEVHLIGLCQGGWLGTMLAARFPGKLRSLTLAGSPIDTDAGTGPIRQLAHSLPLAVYEEMVAAGGGTMPGRFMLTGWKNMHPGKQYLEKFETLYRHVEDADYLARTEKFASWYENPVDLPGRYYLEAIGQLFKENRLAKGRFVALGRTLDLARITIPLYLLAGEADDITTREQVFRAAELFGTPADQVRKCLVPGGHIGLFMGRETLKTAWPDIARWIGQLG